MVEVEVVLVMVVVMVAAVAAVTGEVVVVVVVIVALVAGALRVTQHGEEVGMMVAMHGWARRGRGDGGRGDDGRGGCSSVSNNGFGGHASDAQYVKSQMNMYQVRALTRQRAEMQLAHE